MKLNVIHYIAICLIIALIGFQISSTARAKKIPITRPAAETTDGMTETTTGLKYTDTVVGSGEAAEPRDLVVVHYHGTLYPSGKKFDSSLERGKPFEFRLGVGQVIQGWDEGVKGMKVGGKRTLIIPSQLAYGEHGAPPVIPPNATLKFDVELLEVK